MARSSGRRPAVPRFRPHLGHGAAPAAPGKWLSGTLGVPVLAEEQVVAKVTMPQLGESVAEGTIGKWLKNVGDGVASMSRCSK